VSSMIPVLSDNKSLESDKLIITKLRHHVRVYM